MSASPQDRVGTVIQERYRLEGLIGVGGFGAVYRARHLTMGTTVAIKILNAEHCTDPRSVKRFELEATRSASLVHPNSIKVFDFGPTPTGEFFLAMEYLEGRTLSSLIRTETHVAPDRTVHILSQVLRALDEAHEKGIIHRDLKPDNIFLLQIGHEQDFVKVLDYGISKGRQGQTGLTIIGQVVGTPAYMSPEQCASRELDGRSDLYAIGCIAFHMLTGRTPFLVEDPLAFAIAHVQETPPDVRDAAGPEHPIPAGLAEWVMKLLAKDPADRYPSAHAALDDLSVALTGPSTWKYKTQPATPGKGLVRGEPSRTHAPTHEQAALGTGLSTAVAPKRKPWWVWTLGAAGALSLALGLAAIIVDLAEDEEIVSETVASSTSPPATGTATAPVTRETPDVVASAGDTVEIEDTQADTRVAPDTALAATAPAIPDAVGPADVVPVAEVVEVPDVVHIADTTPVEEVRPSADLIATIRSTPPGASVWIDGARVGMTPYRVRWLRGAEPPRVELRLDGYFPATVTLQARDAGRVRTITLRKRPIFKPLED